MAKLKKNTLGEPTGKVGGLVFKSRKGKPYIATEPVFVNPRQSPLVIESNNKFRFFAKLTPEISDNPRLRSIWEASDVKGDTARHKIFSLNHKLLDESRDLTNFKLVPLDILFPVELTETEYGVNLLTLTFAPFEPTDSWKTFPTISAQGVVRYFDRKSEGYESDYFIQKVSSMPVQYIPGESHTFSMDWNSNSDITYNRKQFCITLILDDHDGIPSACSVNVMVE